MKKIAAVIVLLGLIGCSKKTDEPAPKEIFSLVVDPAYSLSLDCWVFVHDANGIVLDHRQILTSGTYSFKSSNTVANNEVGVTIFTYDSIVNPYLVNYNLSTYLQIPAGQQWNLKYPTTPPVRTAGNLLGPVQLTVNEPDDVIMQIFSGSGRQVADYVGNVFTNNVYENSSDFILTLATNEEIRYQMFSDVAPNSKLTADFSTMKNFDHVLDLTFPATDFCDAYVFSVDDQTSENVNTFRLYIGPDVSALKEIKLGYLDQFKSYNTSLLLQWPTYAFEYLKVGPIPAPMAIPDKALYSITDETFTTFSFSGDQTFAYRNSMFADPSAPANKPIVWNVLGPQGTNKVGDLPSDFLKKYPKIKPGNLKHTQSKFSILPSTTWQNYIDTNFISVTRGDSEEAWIYAY